MEAAMAAVAMAAVVLEAPTAGGMEAVAEAVAGWAAEVMAVAGLVEEEMAVAAMVVGWRAVMAAGARRDSSRCSRSQTCRGSDRS